MTYDFDRIIDRRSTRCAKWLHYEEDVLPLWVADMDFSSPQPIVDALRDRAACGVFGYGTEPSDLRSVIVENLLHRYGWSVSPEALVFVPGLVGGLNLATQAVTSPGDGVLVQTPVYFPFLSLPGNAGCTLDQMRLTPLRSGSYECDMELFEATITGRTRIFVLCNPHNPVGRVFRRYELEQMAEVCLRNDLVICSDEIHCDLVFPGHQHVPFATLDRDIAQRTITLMAPSKTYNIAGLHSSVAIIENPELRKKFERARKGLVSQSLNVFGYTATLAAYRSGQPWLDALLRYLEANRDFVFEYVNTQLQGVTVWKPEGTYLAWLDCRNAGLPGSPHEFFLGHARVALNDGATFGRGGEGFVRLNFACPRQTLERALDRMGNALANLQ
jgi:cystathionine beta-lyase